MTLNKVILSVALGMSFHGAAISMENEINEQINLINSFTKDVIAHNAKDIEPLGIWLTQKRNDIHDDANWNNLINDLLGKITLEDNELAWQDNSNPAISSVIAEIARNLQPGQDCSQELATRAKEAVKEATLEYIKAHDFEIELIW